MKPGIYEKLGNAEYHSSSALSRSGVTTLCRRSPLHFWAAHQDPHRKPVEETPALRLGSAVHAYVLEPEVWESDYAVAPRCDRRTKEGKATWASFVEESEGKTVLKREEGAQAVAIGEAVLKHDLARSLVRGGASEVSVFWEDEETGILCRCRPDHLPPSGQVVDLKTTLDASSAFEKSAYNFGYHHQAAWYLYGCRAAGIDCRDFIFVAVEKTYPYAVAIYRASNSLIALGREEVRYAIKYYARCLESGKWPGYMDEGGTGIRSLGPPSWALPRAGDH